MPSRGQWVTPSNNRQTWTLTKSLSARRLARSDEPRIEPGACTVRSMVMKTFVKKDYPLPNIRRYLEPGPIVLVSSVWKEKTNIMTMGWHMMMQFSPALFGVTFGTETTVSHLATRLATF